MLLVIFADEIFYSYMAFRGIAVESGMKAQMAYLISGIGYLILVIDALKGNVSKRNFKQLLVLGMLLLLYWMTGLFYSPSDVHYKAYLLTYGAYCLPAAIAGMHFARNMDMVSINKLLPYFVIPLTLIIGTTMGSYLASGSMLTNDESGLNYQTVSYFTSYFYAYSAYYCFFSGVSHKGFYGRVLYLMMIITMFLNAGLCLLGGGRGAFVYIVFITIYMIGLMYNSNKRNRWQVTVLVAAIAIVFVLLSNKYGIFESDGVARVTQHLTDDDSRKGLWKTALHYFYESPILGWGLGSIWWTVGFYSHNILTDLLAETGIVGTIIVVYTLWLIFSRLYRMYKCDKSIVFVILVFLGTLLQVTFSGYWISSHQLFFAFGFVFAIDLKKWMKTRM